MTEDSLAAPLLALVQAYPGLHMRELARQLGTSVALVEYHVAALQAEGRIAVRQDGRFHRVYVVGGPTIPVADRRALDVLRRRWPLRIVMELLAAEEGLRHAELSEALGLGKSNLSFHLRALEGAGLVTKDPEGRFRVMQRDRLKDLLARWQPTPDLHSEFASAWTALYGED